MTLPPTFAKWAAMAALGVSTGFAAGYQWAATRHHPENRSSSSAAAPTEGRSSGDRSHSSSSADSKADTSRGPGGKEGIASALEERNSRRRIKRFRLIVTELKPEEFAGAYDQLMRSGNRTNRRNLGLMGELVAEWAEHDPLQAFEKVKNFKPAQMRPYLAGQVLEVLARSNPDAALALLAKEPDGNQQRSMRATLIGAIAESDPTRAKALLREFPDTAKGTGAYTLFSAWAGRDPLGAIELAYQVSDGSSRLQALQIIGSTWAASDPQAAESWVNTLPAGKMRDQLWLNLLYQTTQADPQAAMESILRADLRESTRLQGMQTALTAWSRQDREGALAFILEESNRSLSQRALPSIMNEWIDSDTPAALAWLRQHGAEVGGAPLLEQMARMAAYQNPAAALQLLEDLPGGNTRTQLFQQAANSLAEQDLGAAQAQWAKMPPGPERDQFQQGLLTGMATQDPERAMREVDALSAGPAQDQLRQSLIGTLVDLDPKMAIDWAKRAPEKSQGALFGTAITLWANSDPYAASSWLASLPAGTNRDQAVNSFSNSVVRTDPEGAATWALSIQDESLRISTIRNVARQWKQSDETRAKQWIQGVDLPEKTKEALLR